MHVGGSSSTGQKRAADSLELELEEELEVNIKNRFASGAVWTLNCWDGSSVSVFPFQKQASPFHLVLLKKPYTPSATLALRIEDTQSSVGWDYDHVWHGMLPVNIVINPVLAGIPKWLFMTDIVLEES